MSEPARSEARERRPRLSRDRVLRSAMAVADAGGITALTIRSLAAELGVKPMSVYYYVANKEEILDAIVDIVFSEIDLPSPDSEWRAEIRRRSLSARAVLRRHPWAIPLLQARTHPGPATLRHLNANIGTLRSGGFSVPMTAHAYALIDAYVYGFALSEAALPFDRPEAVEEVAVPIIQSFAAGAYPHLVELTTRHILQPGYDFADEFDFGLNLILDALSKLLPRQGKSQIESGSDLVG